MTKNVYMYIWSIHVRSWRYRCLTMSNRLCNLSIISIFLISSLPPPDNRGLLPLYAQYRLLSTLLHSFSNWWLHLDTVSRQIFEDIQETQFAGSKMEVHVHLKNAFPGGIGIRRISFGYNLWFASHPSSSPNYSYRFDQRYTTHWPLSHERVRERTA